ncbi:MAG: dihydropteroate synthase [Candidatus Azotimanducaceae bacterium]|jgi:dihydropteroate synthase
MAKDTIIGQKSSLLLKGKTIDFSSPKTMGILNITPDSFFDGGQYGKSDALIKKAGQHLDEGATLLDIGAASSRPGAEILNPAMEWDRLAPALETILRQFPEALISIDTYHSMVAEKAIQMGAAMVNDISAGSMDADMLKTVAALNVPYAMMHMRGNPKNMQNNCDYSNITEEIFNYFSQKIDLLKSNAIQHFCIDLGFGFSKTLEQNHLLLHQLKAFEAFDCPMILGLSRKSMFYKLLETSPQEALNATTVGHTIALMQKQNMILRVHDVKAAMEAIKIVTLAQTLD